MRKTGAEKTNGYNMNYKLDVDPSTLDIYCKDENDRIVAILKQNCIGRIGGIEERKYFFYSRIVWYLPKPLPITKEVSRKLIEVCTTHILNRNMLFASNYEKQHIVYRVLNIVKGKQFSLKPQYDLNGGTEFR